VQFERIGAHLLLIILHESRHIRNQIGSLLGVGGARRPKLDVVVNATGGQHTDVRMRLHAIDNGTVRPIKM